ncbi:MAG: ABC transporter ATP-binding protein [Candidatus Adiutricales bacterium]
MEHLKRLLPYIYRYKFPFWGGLAGLVLARVFEAFVPIFLKRAIDSITAGEPYLAVPALAIVGCVTARFLSIVASRRLVRRVGIIVAYDLRKRIYSHLQKQGPGFFARYGTGDLMARAVNDIQFVRMLIGNTSRSMAVMLFSAVIGVFFMFRLSPSLALLILPPLPIIAITAYFYSKKIFDQSMTVQEGFSSLSEFTQENLNGIRTVQAHAQEDREVERFDKVNRTYAGNYLSLIKTSVSISSILPILGSASQVVILGYGGSRVLSGDISIGTFAAFFWYLNMVLWPVRDAGMMVTMVQRGASAAQRLFEILDSEPEIQDHASKKAPPSRLTGQFELKHLSYTYPFAEKQALKDVSFKAEAGEMIAILGRIGSGKSTLLKLFARLLDPEPGSLYLDGRDIHDFPLAQVRSQVALVLQDPFLFAESLKSNLSYDDPERNLDEIWLAAEAADLSDTIMTFPDRMETLVGERGVTLSGGQKQRSTLARGLIRETPILILDDCFSSIDTETEEVILRRLKRIRQGFSTILVSHRVSTVRHADRIVVLDEGRVAEMGTHEELLSHGGLYAHIEAVQNRRYELIQTIEESALRGDG